MYTWHPNMRGHDERLHEHLQEDCEYGVVLLQLHILDHECEGPGRGKVQADALQADASTLALSTFCPHCA